MLTFTSLHYGQSHSVSSYRTSYFIPLVHPHHHTSTPSPLVHPHHHAHLHTLTIGAPPPSHLHTLTAKLSPYQPGDRVQVVGTYRCLPSKRQGYTAGTFRTILIACNVIVLSKEVAPLFSAKDVAKIKRFSRSSRHDPFELLAHSLAPSIHGHHFIKRAVLCMLLGGVEKILENGTRLRG